MKIDDLKAIYGDKLTVNTAIGSLRINAGAWEVSGSMRNLLNLDAREPRFAPGIIVNDIPLPRRSLFVQVLLKL
jgi:iron complex outermembrane receptor protein